MIWPLPSSVTWHPSTVLHTYTAFLLPLEPNEPTPASGSWNRLLPLTLIPGLYVAGSSAHLSPPESGLASSLYFMSPPSLIPSSIVRYRITLF